MSQTERLLSGIKVVEMATFIAGPSCARVLGEWGAEVIKVESTKGDVYRYTSGNGTDDENPIFAIDNTGKQFISVDMKTEQGTKIVDDLIKNADIFITNFRVDALKKINLTYEELSEKYPQLIYAHIQGYGEKGPLKDKPGFDSTAFCARGGLLLGMAQKGETPCNYGQAVGDHTLGMYVVSGILAALFNRTKTGKGELVTSGLYQSAIYTVGTMLTMIQIGLGIEFPLSRKTTFNPLNNIYRCKDDLWIMLAGTDYLSYLNKFAKIVNIPILIEHEGYNSPLGGLIYSEEITKLLEEKLAEKTRKEWEDIFKENDFPCEILMNMPDILEDEQAWANNFLSKCSYPSGNSGIIANVPVFFGSQSPAEFKHPTGVGGNTVEILKSLGYSDNRIEDLISAGTVVV